MTVPRPMQYLATGNCRSGRSGRSGPPLCGGIPPATPPLCIPPCVRVSSLSPTRPSCRRHRACAFPACPRRARRVDATVRARFQPVPDAPVVSTPPCVRVSSLSPTRPSCRRHRACAFPACPRRARRVDATVRARFQPVPDAPVVSTPPCVRVSSLSPTRPSCRRHRGVRVSSLSPTRPSCRRHRACAFPGCPRRARRVDATVRARFQLVPDATVRARRPQFELRITNHESRPFRPSLVRGDSPRNAPLAYTTVRARFQAVPDAPVVSTPPCVRVSSLSPTPPCVRGARSSNCESRITNHGHSGPPLCGGIPPATPPLCIPPCVRVSSLSPTRPSCRRHRACAFPACPRRARHVDATVRARFQLVPDATVRARRPQFESRITNHESRITAIPALPCAGGFPPQRPPCVYYRASAFPSCPRRARRVDATVRARFHPVLDAPVMSTPPCERVSILSPTRPSCRRHRTCASPANVSAPVVPPPPCVRVPGCRRRAANTMPPSGRIAGQSRVRPTSTAPSSSRPLTTDH